MSINYVAHSHTHIRGIFLFIQRSKVIGVSLLNGPSNRDRRIRVRIGTKKILFIMENAEIIYQDKEQVFSKKKSFKFKIDFFLLRLPTYSISENLFT